GLYVERLLHERFQASRIQGEWFSLTEREVEAFSTIAEECNIHVRDFKVPTKRQRFWRKFAHEHLDAVERARQFQQAHPERTGATG
ncbi:MAG: GIY-YIG nuclease family protein, partial [Candidatus Sulfotelmatobacter sp.]